ncbi:unnamed protein product [Fructobacillus fructosus]|uniref:hypothetical protein n=1 Tax=Fructobacillus fructosus TaxID=1631 RepID=UPI002D9F902C|nr:unnamed protein product [Fructobacillus fructosus]
MNNEQAASTGVQIVSHNSIDLVSHNKFVAQSIHQKIELMRYFVTTSHQFRSKSPFTGNRTWKKFKYYLSFFKILDWVRLIGFFIGISILRLAKLFAYFLLYFFMLAAILTVLAKTASPSWQSVSFLVVYTVIFVLCRFTWRWIRPNNRDPREFPNNSILKILWLKSSGSTTDKELRPVILCLLPEWLDSSLNPNQLTITGEIDPLTLKRMWRKLSLFEKHVIMSDEIAVMEPNNATKSVEFVSSSLPYRDELIASIYQSQQSK